MAFPYKLDYTKAIYLHANCHLNKTFRKRPILSKRSGLKGVENCRGDLHILRFSMRKLELASD
jgi:hypothetical protein